MKNGDRVDDEGKDVGDGLGGDVRRWLVVGCRDGREFLSKRAATVRPLFGSLKKAEMPLPFTPSPVSL